MLLQTPSIFDIFCKIWLFIISKSQRRFVLLSLIPNTPTPATTCLLLCLSSLSWSDPGRVVSVFVMSKVTGSSKQQCRCSSVTTVSRGSTDQPPHLVHVATRVQPSRRHVALISIELSATRQRVPINITILPSTMSNYSLDRVIILMLMTPR